MNSPSLTLLTFGMVVAVGFLSGCTPQRGNLVGPTGNGINTTYTLQDSRAARSHIKVVHSLPDGARKLGDYEVQRCHQYAQHQPPSDAVLTDDLVLLAYAQGADGIYGVRFDRESGLLKNCWHVAKGFASFYKNNK